jgi:hypothetical protein
MQSAGDSAVPLVRRRRVLLSTVVAPPVQLRRARNLSLRSFQVNRRKSNARAVKTTSVNHCPNRHFFDPQNEGPYRQLEGPSFFIFNIIYKLCTLGGMRAASH